MIQTSPEINEIATALAKAQATIQNVGKSGTATGNSFTYKYAELPEVLDEARAKLSAEGIYILQATVNGEGHNIGVITRLLHSSGQWIESALYCAPSKFDAQGVGSVSTYLRRYSLMSMIGMGAEKDDDGAAATVAAPQAPRAGIVRAADVPPQPQDNGNRGGSIKQNGNGNGNGDATMSVERRATIFREEMTARFAKCRMPTDVDTIIHNNNKALEGLKKMAPEVYAEVMQLSTNAKNALYGETG